MLGYGGGDGGGMFGTQHGAGRGCVAGAEPPGVEGTGGQGRIRGESSGRQLAGRGREAWRMPKFPLNPELPQANFAAVSRCCHTPGLSEPTSRPSEGSE